MPIDPHHRLIHEIADELEPEVRRAFLDAVESARDLVPVSQIEGAFRDGNLNLIMDIMERLVRERLQVDLKTLEEIMTTAMRRTGRILSRPGILPRLLAGFAFDMTNPRALEYVAENTGRLIEGITENTMGSIRRVVFNEAFIGGVGAEAPARSIRDVLETEPVITGTVRDVVGLLPKHADAVVRYYEELLGEGIDPTRAEELRSLYAHRLRTWRANMISRTEIMMASNAGQYELWAQMFDSGVLQWDRTWIEWVVAEDDRLCPWCAPLDGKRRRHAIGASDVEKESEFKATEKGFPKGVPTAESTLPPRRPLKPDPYAIPRNKLGQFISKAVTGPASEKPRFHLDPVLFPPLHPHCRCVLRLVFED